MTGDRQRLVDQDSYVRSGEEMREFMRAHPEATGLVTTEKVGRARRCSLGPRRLEDIEEWIELYRRMLDERLDRFGELLERTKRDQQ